MIQPGLFAIALLSNPEWSAASCLLSRNEGSHEDLIRLVQEELLGVDLDDLQDILDRRAAVARFSLADDSELARRTNPDPTTNPTNRHNATRS